MWTFNLRKNSTIDHGLMMTAKFFFHEKFWQYSKQGMKEWWSIWSMPMSLVPNAVQFPWHCIAAYCFGYSVWNWTTLDVNNVDMDHVEYHPYIQWLCAFQPAHSDICRKLLYLLVIFNHRNHVWTNLLHMQLVLHKYKHLQMKSISCFPLQWQNMLREHRQFWLDNGGRVPYVFSSR